MTTTSSAQATQPHGEIRHSTQQSDKMAIVNGSEIKEEETAR